jgi:hypothetical protein
MNRRCNENPLGAVEITLERKANPNLSLDW